MTMVHRVLDPEPLPTLGDHVARGGWRAFDAALRLGPEQVVEVIEESGLRGRGGAGFPTGTKWRTVAGHTGPQQPATVVVNAAEGEPGSFKDRALLRTNPYKVLEGALIAAYVVGADRVVVATKATHRASAERVRAAVAELAEERRVFDGVSVEVFDGPDSYLFGEETALLEAIDGRAPFPQIVPPWRHGVGQERATTAQAGIAAETEVDTDAPVALANNVETLAHVADILLNGPSWFRELGTEDTPGTILCTVTGATSRHGVGELAAGTTLRAALESIGHGPTTGRKLGMVTSGVSHPIIPEARFDTPLDHAAMEDAGSGLGSASFIAFDTDTDPVAVAQGIARFLAVESCGQCTPCKADGLAIADHLDELRRSEADERELSAVADRLATVADSARCSLARQQEAIGQSFLALFGGAVADHVAKRAPASPPVLIAPISDIRGGRAYLSEDQAAKQPDWSTDATWSGQWPTARLSPAAT